MTNSLIALAFWCLAAFCNAVMDTIVHHFPISRFARLKGSKLRDWIESDYRRKGQYLFHIDGWHLFKGLMLFNLIMSICLYDGNLWLFPVFVGAWYAVFQTFYHKALLV